MGIVLFLRRSKDQPNTNSVLLKKKLFAFMQRAFLFNSAFIFNVTQP